MASFICKVITPQGQIVKLKLEEEDKITCLKKLKRNGMTPISVKSSFNILKFFNNRKKATATIHSNKNKRINKSNIIRNSKKVKLQEIREFTEDFYFLKQSKFTNRHALITIINKTENLYLKDVLRKILKNIDEENFMYKAMKEYPDIFPIIYVNFIKTGELTDCLEESLKHAIIYLSDEEKINKKIQTELIPNTITFFGIIIVLMLIVLIGIPNLQKIFESYGSSISLPKVTLVLFGIVKALIKYWYIYAILIVAIILGFIKYINTNNGKYKFHKYKYTNFFFGKIIFLLDFSRISRSLFLNLKKKMRIQDSLEISKNFTSNVYMLNLLEKSINNVYIGKSWIEPFEDEEILNPIIIEMLKKSTKIISIENMEKSIEYLHKDIEKEIDKVLKTLQTISYGLVGIALLLFIIIVLIPCMQIYLSGILFI